jgi:branched-chain amino acid transport system substrate-binding protein
MMFPGVAVLMDEYQSWAPAADADLVGSYMAPQAYAQMEVVGQAITITQGLDDTTLANYTRTASFETVVGSVKFGVGGEWNRLVSSRFSSRT